MNSIDIESRKKVRKMQIVPPLSPLAYTTDTSSHLSFMYKHFGVILIMLVAFSFLIGNILLNIKILSNLQHTYLKLNDSSGQENSYQNIYLNTLGTTRRNVKEENSSKKSFKGPDFFIAGFPKCGTTTLLYSFLKHNETAISDKEYCRINTGLGSMKKLQELEHLEETLDKLVDEGQQQQQGLIKRGIKCPNSIHKFNGLQRLAEVSSGHHQNTKLIIGVRHPVLFFQSFYNYRIIEFYNKKLNLKNPSDLSKLHEEENGERQLDYNHVWKLDVPPAETLIGAKSWNQVSTDMARFDLSLKQLGKTALSSIELQEMGIKDFIVSPTKFKVFLYTTDQLEDKNQKRSNKFRFDMQKFLGLNAPIDPFTRENNNSAVHFPGSSINICDEKYRNLRSLLVRQGNITQKWIEEHFILSKDVFVSDRQYFLTSIQKWSIDPCS